MIVTEIEDGLLKKVKEYGRKFKEEVPEEEAHSVIRYLLKDEPVDLGGLTALRGFVYQYYVAIHYIVEMIHENHAWWNEVIFEFLDDIALLGNDKIRFVQVKTVREDGQDRHLIPSTLLKRESGLDSWLDTLFSNVTDFNRRKAELMKQHLMVDEFSLQFEIATNAPYDSKNLKLYAQNDSYEMLGSSILDGDVLLSGLSKVYQKKIKNKDKSISIEEYNFSDVVGQEPKWCLQRFYLNHLGCIENLKEKIIGKISDYCKMRFTTITGLTESAFQKKSLSGDGLLYDYVARKVFKQLLLLVIERTHRDDLPDNSLLVFNKVEIVEWIEQWRQKALIEIQRDVDQAVKRKQFIKCFEELKEEIDTTWNPVLKADLMNTISWMYDALEQEVTNGNPYVYEQFLNRLFYMNNSHLPSEQRMKDEIFLKESLKYMMICMAFYPDRNFLFSNAQLLFKKGKQGDEAWNIFTIYNAREKESYEQALRRIVSRSKECPFTQSLQYTYYCFVTHDDKTQLLAVESDPFATLIPITQNPESTESEIIEQPQNIKFQKADKLNLIINRFNSSSNTRSFQDQAMRSTWHTFLNKHD